MSDLPNVPEDVLDRLEEENDVLTSQLARIESVFIPSVPADVVYRKIDGENPILAWREYRRLTIEALAELAQVSPADLRRWERDEPISLRDLGRLVEALKVSADEILPYPQRD